VDMAAFGSDSLIADSGSLWRGLEEDATKIQHSEDICMANTLLRVRFDFAGSCARFSNPRNRRAAFLGPHDAARNPHADFGPASRTRSTSDSISLGIVAVMARTGGDPQSWKTFQDTLDHSFGAIPSMVAFRAGIVGLACPPAIPADIAERLGSRGPTYDLPDDSAAVLVASREPNLHSRLWRRIGVCLHDNSPYQCLGSVAHVCAPTLVFVVCNNRSHLALHSS
jgi:hypothetical protein